MVKIIMGLKGSGKTKELVGLVCKAVIEGNGDVVVIEKDRREGSQAHLRYSLSGPPHRRRQLLHRQLRISERLPLRAPRREL